MFASKRKPAVLIVAGAAALCAGVTSLVNCSGGGTSTGTPSSASHGGSPTVIGTSNAGTGTVGLALNLPGGAQVNSVTYDLLNSGGTPVSLPSAPNPGTVNVSNSASIDFQLGGVPAATGDSISLTASIAGGGTCQGSASGINVTAGATTTVTVQMLCSVSGPDAGNLFVTGATSYCGTWTSLSTNSSEVYVGESLVLTATATGPNPSNLGYTWTMSNPIGAFGATAGGVGAQGQDEGVGPSDPMQFMCTAPGTTTVTLVVDDGLNDAGACPTNLTTLTTTVLCDAAPSNQVASAWVELTGPNGSNGLTGNVAIARAITEATAADGGANPCPTITINGGTPVQMNLRAAATTSLALRSVNTLPPSRRCSRSARANISCPRARPAPWSPASRCRCRRRIRPRSSSSATRAAACRMATARRAATTRTRTAPIRRTRSRPSPLWPRRRIRTSCFTSATTPTAITRAPLGRGTTAAGARGASAGTPGRPTCLRRAPRCSPRLPGS